MKRDSNLVAKILLFAEERGSRMFKGCPQIQGYEREAVVDHIYLLVSGGFIELGQETLANRGPLVLTWKGCDYLDEIRARSAKRPSPAPAQTSRK